jgi:hypothetical protein
MNLLLLLAVAVPLSYLAFLSGLALLGVMTLRAIINVISSGLRDGRRPQQRPELPRGVPAAIAITAIGGTFLWQTPAAAEILVDSRRAAYLRETDCVAEHIGLELRNVAAIIPLKGRTDLPKSSESGDGNYVASRT